MPHIAFDVADDGVGFSSCLRIVVSASPGAGNAIVRSGFRRLLEQQSDFQVVAEAADGERAYALFVEQEPDVVVMDLSMPGVSGLDTIRKIISGQPAARILVLSMHEDASVAERAIQLGARGYATKSNAPEVLASAVADVASGKLALSPDIAKSIALLRSGGAENPLRLLSAREFEIFRSLVGGRAAAEIAKLLNLSGKTVANYHTLIKQKLRMTNDVELVLLAQRQNIICAFGASHDIELHVTADQAQAGCVHCGNRPLTSTRPIHRVAMTSF